MPADYVFGKKTPRPKTDAQGHIPVSEGAAAAKPVDITAVAGRALLPGSGSASGLPVTPSAPAALAGEPPAPAPQVTGLPASIAPGGPGAPLPPGRSPSETAAEHTVTTPPTLVAGGAADPAQRAATDQNTTALTEAARSTLGLSTDITSAGSATSGLKDTTQDDAGAARDNTAAVQANTQGQKSVAPAQAAPPATGEGGGILGSLGSLLPVLSGVAALLTRRSGERVTDALAFRSAGEGVYDGVALELARLKALRVQR